MVRVIKSRRLRLAGHIVLILTFKPTGKKALRRFRRKWEDSIRIDRNRDR